VLAVHGITGSSASWAAVAEALPDDWRMVAVDLRGRGHSRDLPGPWGLRRHAEDVCDLARELGPCTLVGHSMGAYISTLAAADHPELFDHVVLVDGAVPLPLPDGLDPDQVLQTTLGPALARLRQTYDDEAAYVDFFRAHPALGPYWSDVVEDYVRYDALATPDGVVSRARDDAVREDGRDLLVLGAELDAALRAAPEGTDLLVAPRGMFDGTPGMLPEAAVATYAEQVPSLSVRTVPDVNHYTIMFDRTAAATVAEAVVGRLGVS
jgi:pimeloyl-ACP methyl ester carboxylesterase